MFPWKQEVHRSEMHVLNLTNIYEVCNSHNRQTVTMKKVNKQCLLDTPRTVRVSEKTWQVIARTRRP